jgi:hypothetical protein
MRQHSLLLATLLLLPSAAIAQRGSGSQAAKKTELFDNDPTPQGPSLRARDIEDQSPLKLLLDKHKDVKLTDAQSQQFKDAQKQLEDKNAPLLKTIDSLVHEMRTNGTPTPDDENRVRNSRLALMNVLGQVRTTYDSAAKSAIAGLTADQQPKATELVDKQREDASKTIRQKLGGGRS